MQVVTTHCVKGSCCILCLSSSDFLSVINTVTKNAEECLINTATCQKYTYSRSSSLPFYVVSPGTDNNSHCFMYDDMKGQCSVTVLAMQGNLWCSIRQGFASAGRVADDMLQVLPLVITAPAQSNSPDGCTFACFPYL